MVFFAFYSGILNNNNPRELLQIAIFRQDGRSLLKKLIKTSPILSGKEEGDFAKGHSSLFSSNNLPSARLLCQESQIVFWKSIIQKVKLPADHVTVHGDGTTGLVSQYCENPELLRQLEHQDVADLIACEFWIPRERAKIVLAGETMVFYSRSIGKRLQDMSKIYPSKEPSSLIDCVNRQNNNAGVDLVLAVDSRHDSSSSLSTSDWKSWIKHLQDAFSSRQDSWQRLIRSSNNPFQFDVRVVEAVKFENVFNQDDNTTSHSMHGFNPQSLEEMFGQPPKNRLEVLFYLSPHESAYFIEDSTTGDAFSSSMNPMAAQGSRLVRILPSLSASKGPADASKREADMEAIVRQTFDDATDWITRQCMGLAMDDSTDEELLLGDDNDIGLARWYWKIWWQRLLSSLHDKAVHMARRQSKIWAESSYRVPLTSEVINKFRTHVLDVLEHDVPELLANQSSSTTAAIEALEEAIDWLQFWERDETYMPPLDFPPEQYAAIFAPLVLPLLLPLLVGLFREYKRYKELQRKKKDSEESSRGSATAKEKVS